MARETKVERTARIQREVEEARRSLSAKYPSALMALLERVSTEPTLTLTVMNGFFNVETREDHYRRDYVLSYHWSNDSQEALDDLAYKLDSLEEERREEQRRYEVKREALRKVNEMLSDEERELLGL